MLRDGVGRCRPIERLCCSNGMRVVEIAGLREGRWYVVDRRLYIMVPDWAKGRQMREAMIARQLVLFGLATQGEERLGPALVAFVGEAFSRLAGEAA